MRRVSRDAKALIEQSQIDWRRDWDALVLGFVLGVLATVTVQSMW